MGYKHPETKNGEVLLGNFDLISWRSVGWLSKRAGEVAYDMFGNVVPELFPGFALASETGFEVSEVERRHGLSNEGKRELLRIS